jgi:hypothetical protein
MASGRASSGKLLAIPFPTVAVAPGAGLPGQFASKDWTLVQEPSVLHSGISEDVTTKGYCYFQLVKG